jgi:hypothetical protein
MHVGLLVAGVALSGAATWVQAPPKQPSYSIAQAPDGLRPAIHHADRVIASLQKALSSELSRELGRSGPAGAIDVCHLAATEAAQKAAREEGVAAGRTSHRLRNPTNAPRPWAAAIVGKHAGKAAADIDGYVVELDDRIGVLRPIPQRAACAGCHGPVDRLSPAVREELKERYPADQATGFKDGDLRGWFWVEVPKGIERR